MALFHLGFHKLSQEGKVQSRLNPGFFLNQSQSLKLSVLASVHRSVSVSCLSNLTIYISQAQQ